VLIELLLAASLLQPADFWHRKRFTEWTPDEVRKLLIDSPWARPVLLPVDSIDRASLEQLRSACSSCEVKSGGGPVMAAGMPELAGPLTVIVRWHSALPVKQALIRAKFGDEAATSREAVEFLARDETAYIVGVSGVPAHLAPADAAQLRANAFLRRKGRPPLSAADAQVAPGENSVHLLLFFPRSQDSAHAITPADGQIEVQLQLGPLNIRRSFKLKDMIYEGRLAM